jgi:[ribosomal protein S5]-alanine N-acetyltransferase
LRLEPVVPEHTADLVRLHNDPNVAYWLAGPWTAERAAAWAERQRRSWSTEGVGRWMAYRRVDGSLVGRGGPAWVELLGARVLELGWIVRDELRGHGYASEIGRASVAFAFEVVGVEEVVAYTEVDNVASRAVMVGLGMTEHGIVDEPGLLSGVPLDRELSPFVLYRLRRPSWGRGSGNQASP